MATRRKRQTNILHDQTNGTVTISHGSSSKPQNTGFFGGGFTNTGASSSKRRRRRLRARAQQQAAQLKPMLKLKRRQSVGLQKMQRLKQEPRQKPQNEHVLKRRYAHRLKKIRHIDRLLKR